MLKLHGIATSSFRPFIGIVTHGNRGLFARKDYILVDNKIGVNSIGYLGGITGFHVKEHFYTPDCVCEVKQVEILQDGDLVRLNPDGEIQVLWEQNSSQNVLFLTEACNCQCLMCPQPPAAHKPELVKTAERLLDLLYGRKVGDICISGGEPTILKDKFIHILKRCVFEHPEAQIAILTNGKLLSDQKYADEVSRIATSKTVFCVSMHSDISEIHDRIVGKKGSFNQTVNGIYNLAENNCCIEIRIVINKLNYKDLPRIARHLSNYFPFCVHYVFMGMEIHGLAKNNFESINAYPQEYYDALKEAVIIMVRSGLNVSVYNVPLCMCHKAIWRYAEKSISSWKNIYIDKCNQCTIKDKCCGFFETSAILPIEFIRPVII